MKYRKAQAKILANYPKPHEKTVECHMIQAPKWRPLLLCVHKELDYTGSQTNKWVLSDMTTGLKISKSAWKTREQAIKDGIGRLTKAGHERVVKQWEAFRAGTLTPRKDSK